jgi:hypothetical protein
MKIFLLLTAMLLLSPICFSQQKSVPLDSCSAPKLAQATPGYRQTDIPKQPAQTADLPSVVQTVEQALQCYQLLTLDRDPMQPKGLPKLSSAVMDFRTTTGKTTGLSFSVFIFKVGASREKDVTDDLSFTYSVPKPPIPPHSFSKVTPASLYEELVKEIQAAAQAAESQSTAIGMPLSKVSITISYGIKFDGNASINAPVQLVTIGGNGDYNKNNTQTITLNFGQ